jgi:hypothetical protein
MARQSAAERNRRYRARQRAGRSVVAVEVADPFGLVDTLIDRGLLSEKHCEDRSQLAAAAGRALDEWVKKNRDASR